MSKNKWRRFFALACALALSGTVLAYAAEPSNRNGANNPDNSSVCMPGVSGGSMMGSGDGCNVRVIDDKTAETEMTASLMNAAIDKPANTIVYTGKTVNIVMFAGPENKFVIGEIINPTLRVELGANVTLEIINKDNGAAHGVEVTSTFPPYAHMMMMQEGIYPGTLIRPVAAAKSGKYSSSQTVFLASLRGTYYYICQIPGHAESGMYGQIIIE